MCKCCVEDKYVVIARTLFNMDKGGALMGWGSLYRLRAEVRKVCCANFNATAPTFAHGRRRAYQMAMEWLGECVEKYSGYNLAYMAQKIKKDFKLEMPDWKLDECIKIAVQNKIEEAQRQIKWAARQQMILLRSEVRLKYGVTIELD